MFPRVSIILVNLNGLTDTIACVESLKNIKYPNFEILVVDNHSRGNDVAELGKLETDNLHLIRSEKNLGFTGGNNLGIKHVLAEGKSDFILLLNNDTVVDPNFLGLLIEPMLTNSQIGITGPKIHYFDQREAGLWFGGSRFNPYKATPEHLYTEEIQTAIPCPFMTGCALCFRKEVVEKIGLLDDNLFIYFEDAVFCLHAQQAGFQIYYIPESRIWHKVSRTTGGKGYFYYYLTTRNHLYYYRKLQQAGIKAWHPGFYLLLRFTKNFFKYLVQFKLTEAKALLRSQIDAIRDYRHKKWGYQI